MGDVSEKANGGGDVSDVKDSPVGWVGDHIRSYVKSGGQEGHEWMGVPTLLLTTTGRKSGSKRRTALIYGRDGDDYVVVASKGGAPNHPAWYLNLDANPDVEVQVFDDTFHAKAHTAGGTERERLWVVMKQIWPAYEDYQTKTSRQIPVVVLTPSG
jgi:deazaflavin-dependent oxidoreductase (nitroreductase family)